MTATSLRSRLVIMMVGSIAVLLLLFGALIYGAIRKSLRDELDASLTSMARALAAAVEVEEGEIEIDLEPGNATSAEAGESGFLYQIWGNDSATAVRSLSLGQVELARFHGDSGRLAFRNAVLSDGRRVRAAGMRFSAASEKIILLRDDGSSEVIPDNKGAREQGLVLVVARDLDRVDARLRALLGLLIVAGAATLGMALLASSVAVQRGLAPVRSLARDIEAIDEEVLSQRVDPSRMPEEIRPVAQKLNDLLDRLRVVFDREKHFAADAAHELRTPLAGLRVTVEVALSRERADADYRQGLAECLPIVEQLQRVVETLLMLARLDSTVAHREREPVHVADVVGSCWPPFADKAAERQLSFESRVDRDLVCTSELDNLVIVFASLFENAVAYADAGGRIWVEAETRGDRVEVRIANTGCTLMSDQMAQVFSRFWRAEPARQEAGRHCGLGLAVVQRIMKALGGRATAERVDRDVFLVRLVLPR